MQEAGRAAFAQKGMDTKMKEAEVNKMKFKKEQLEQKLKQITLLNRIKGRENVSAQDIDKLNVVDNFIDIEAKNEKEKKNEEMLIK
jgi:hypothetical protein